MSRLFREKDWAASSLGPVESWPPSLITLVGTMLRSPFPIFISWGPDRIFLYNDAYRPILGSEKHPKALGARFPLIWSEIWSDLGPIVEQVDRGIPGYFEDLPLFMNRSGYFEQTYFTFSYSPIPDENGRTQGLLCTCVETTQKKKTEIALQASEMRMQRMFDRSSSFMAVIGGDDLVFEEANDLYLKLLGGRPVVGLRLDEVLPEIEDMGFDRILRRVMETGEPYFGNETRLFLRRRPGTAPEESYVDFSFHPDEPENGRINRVFIFGADVTEKVLARKDLEKSEEKFRSLSDSMPQMVFVADPGGRTVHLNRRWYEYTGLPENQNSHELMWTVLHPDDVPGLDQSWSRAKTEGLIWTFQYRVRSRTGDYRWHLGRSVPIRDSEGRIVRWVGTATDIHDQRQAQEDQLFRAELTERMNRAENVDQLISSATGALALHLGSSRCFLTDIDNRTARAVVLKDYARGELPSLLGEYDLMSFGESMVASWRDGRPVTVNDVRLDPRTRDDADAHLAIGIRSFITIPLVRRGDLVGALNVTDGIPRSWKAREIELARIVAESIWASFERVRLLETIRKSGRQSDFLARASSLLNSSLDADHVLKSLSDLAVPELADWCSIRMVDQEGILKQVAVSHQDPDKVKWAWEIDARYSPDPNTTSGVYQVLRTGRSEIVENVTDELIDRNLPLVEHRRIVRAVGFRSYMSVPIRARDRVIGTLSLICTDESGRRFSRDDLWLAEEIGSRAGVAVDNARLYLESQNVNRAKDEFLATLSHELRTPLNVIMGHADLLQTSGATLDEDMKVSLDAIFRNARAQTQIINDLLDVSAIITGKISFDPERLDPVETARQALEAVRPLAASKEVRLDFRADGPPIELTADPTRLQQVIWNLLSNAVKFTPPGGTVSLLIRRDEASCVIEVRDTGRGIDPLFLPHVFDRFRQEDSTLTRKFGGLGLGLSIVRQLVELHGGRIQARSEGKDRGSRFTVSLPLAEAGVRPSDPSTF